MIKRLVIYFTSLPVNGQILSLPARSEPIVRVEKARVGRHKFINDPRG